MLTVDQIKNISFKKASIGGYRPDEVDEFIDEVTATVEELKKQNLDIIAKSEVLVNKIEEYRGKEDSISSAEENALKEAERIKEEAVKQAAEIIEKAKAEADEIIADANNRVIHEKEMIAKIEQEAADVRKKLTDAYQLQIDALKVLPKQKEVDAIKNGLDEEYPTETYSEEKSGETGGEAFETIEEAAEDAKAETEDTAAAEADTEPGTIQIEKSAFERKFGKLKFGDDYDVKTEE